MSNSLKILVTGATGKQGGAVARLLLKKGHAVRALTRNADSPAAKALAAAGAEIVLGKLEDRGSLDGALKGVDAAFIMTTPFEAGMEVETLQGITAADAARAAGVFLLYTSVASADKQTGVPHFVSKYLVEQHIRRIGAKAAVIAPTYFMENSVAFTRAQLKDGIYSTPLSPDRKLAQVALADIASVAVAILENPEPFAGKRYELVGEVVSGNDAVEILSRVTGKKFSYYQFPLEMVAQAMGDDMVKMYGWMERGGYTVDQVALKRDFPAVFWHSYEAWAREQDWKAIFSGQ